MPSTPTQGHGAPFLERAMQKHYFVLIEERGMPTLKVYTEPSRVTKGNALVLKAQLSKNQLLNLIVDGATLVSRLWHE